MRSGSMRSDNPPTHISTLGRFRVLNDVYSGLTRFTGLSLGPPLVFGPGSLLATKASLSLLNPSLEEGFSGGFASHFDDYC